MPKGYMEKRRYILAEKRTYLNQRTEVIVTTFNWFPPRRVSVFLQ